MNTQDMYSREKNNQIHLDEMQRDALNRQLLRDAKGSQTSMNAAHQIKQILSLIIKKVGTGLASVVAPRHVHRKYIHHHVK